MKMRFGAALLVTAVGLLTTGVPARAQHVGAVRASSGGTVSDAHCCQQGRGHYKVVYDTVTEQRYRTTYKTVSETVTKQVMEVCYKDETRTHYRTCYRTAYKDVQEECLRPVTRCVMKQV
ncbi:MAG: hypothetical protein NZO58_12610, partial [Gemmataceae bacterium]|nr:hypothetical protein [Gemmataceae bacterium]